MSDTPNGDLDGQSNPLNDVPSQAGEFFPNTHRNSGKSEANDEEQFHFTVLAKNACINSHDRLVHVLAELENEAWDVVLFSETRATTNMVILDGGHALYTSISDNACAGVGILLHERHVKQHNRILNVSGRVLALDFVANGKRVRSIAVYVPHCGYSVQDLEEVYEQLWCTISEARRLKRSVIIGGDFNTQLFVGQRGILIKQLSEEFGLRISNDNMPQGTNTWTFCSSVGVKRRIDYILVSNNLLIHEAGPSGILDLGSDHRVVRTVLIVRKLVKRQWEKRYR